MAPGCQQRPSAAGGAMRRPMTTRAGRSAFYGAILPSGSLAPFVFPNYTQPALRPLDHDALRPHLGHHGRADGLQFARQHLLLRRRHVHQRAVVQIGLVLRRRRVHRRLRRGEGRLHARAVLHRPGLGPDRGGHRSRRLFAVLSAGVVFGLRGPYFAIGTLGVAIAAGELVGAWDYGSAAAAASPCRLPRRAGRRAASSTTTSFVGRDRHLRLLPKWLYGTRFGWRSTRSATTRKRPRPWASTPCATRPWPGPWPPSSWASPAPSSAT